MPKKSWFVHTCLKLGCNVFVTKVKLDLISDVDIYLLLEKRMTDGISYICKRYSKANKKYLTSYDSKKPTKYIT